MTSWRSDDCRSLRRTVGNRSDEFFAAPQATKESECADSSSEHQFNTA